jgi:hypothetical protein
MGSARSLYNEGMLWALASLTSGGRSVGIVCLRTTRHGVYVVAKRRSERISAGELGQVLEGQHSKMIE